MKEGSLSYLYDVTKRACHSLLAAPTGTVYLRTLPLMIGNGNYLEIFILLTCLLLLLFTYIIILHNYLSHCYTIAWDRLSNQFLLYYNTGFCSLVVFEYSRYLISCVFVFSGVISEHYKR